MLFRSLALAALEEGCVGEYKASVKAEMEWQCVLSARDRHCNNSTSSPDACADLAALSETLKVIARDEAGHAALAFHAVRWATRTDTEAWKQVDLAVNQLSLSSHSASSLSLQTAVDRAVRSWWATGDLAPEWLRMWSRQESFFDDEEQQKCECGNVFMPDAIFCRRCGNSRESAASRSEEHTSELQSP